MSGQFGSLLRDYWRLVTTYPLWFGTLPGIVLWYTVHSEDERDEMVRKALSKR
jgi:hypothetical protein